MKKVNILGIETSCDETAASVVCNGKTILSHVVASSMKHHAKYGGVIPEIASRHHMELISSIVKQALKDAKLTLEDIHSIAVTSEPGLIGSLLVGTSFAKGLSFASNKPIVEINHVQAHLYANFVRFVDKTKNEGEFPKSLPKLPAIGLVISGGHSNLYHLKSFKNFQLIGKTRDDAIGEAFDKVAKVLNLGYPGGPIIDKLAKKGKNESIKFTCAKMPGTYDFSFSGIKTAVLYYTKKNKNFSKEKIAYSFQKSAINILIDKSINACLKKKIKTLLVGGGVAANSYLRKKLIERADDEGIKVFLPPLTLCMDNAVIIAGLGYHPNNVFKN